MPVRQRRRGPIVVFVALVVVTTGIVISGIRADALVGRTVIAGAAIVVTSPLPGVGLDNSPSDSEEPEATPKRQVVPPPSRPDVAEPTKPHEKSAPAGAERAERQAKQERAEVPAEAKQLRAEVRAEARDARAQAKQARAEVRATVKQVRSELQEQAKAARAELRKQAKQVRAEGREVRRVVRGHLGGHAKPGRH